MLSDQIANRQDHACEAIVNSADQGGGRGEDDIFAVPRSDYQRSPLKEAHDMLHPHGSHNDIFNQVIDAAASV